MPYLYSALFSPFLVSGARPRVADIARSRSQATVLPVPRRPMVKVPCRCETSTIWWRGGVAGVASGSFPSPTVPPSLTDKKCMSPTDFDQAID